MNPRPQREADLFERRRVDTPERYASVLRFWVDAYGLDERFLHTDEVLAGRLEVDAYYRGEHLVATVGFKLASDGLLFNRPLPKGFPPSDDIVEIAKLCLAPEYRRTSLDVRLCGDVHGRLVRAGRQHLAITAPDWLHKRYAFIGFRPTGVRFDIPGIPGSEMEIMLTRQVAFGTYGLHVDPLRWNIFLGAVTHRMIAAGTLRPTPAQRAAIAVYSTFAPLARMLERQALRPLPEVRS